MRFLFPAAIAVLVALGARGARAADPGVIAYQGVPAGTAAQSVRGTLTATADAGDPRGVSIDLAEYRPGTQDPLRDYEVEMTKKLHLIAVSDDFATFLHVHPALGADGHFRMKLTAPRAAIYHVYADSRPAGLGHQVLRFDVHVGTARVNAAPPQLRASRVSTAGPYTVTFDPGRIRAGELTMLTLHIRRGAAPAGDIHPYLGGPAHAVFINTRTLAYVHVHPMAPGAMAKMSGMSTEEPALPDDAKVDPDMMLHVMAPDPGTYRMWLQFRGGSRLYVAPFRFDVQ
jgi:hypothetical protein